MPRRCRVVHKAHSLSQSLLISLHLTVHYTEQNATIKLCLANDDSRPIADLTHTKQFLLVVFTVIKLPVKQVRFVFCSVHYTPPSKRLASLWVAGQLVVIPLLKWPYFPEYHTEYFQTFRIINARYMITTRPWSYLQKISIFDLV